VLASIDGTATTSLSLDALIRRSDGTHLQPE
jgi:hypothetical protein